MPGFIRRMAQTAGSNPAIGTVTAVSNNGSIASVPGLADARNLGDTLPESLIAAPLAGAHLIYVKARAIQKYGWFDPSLSSSAAVIDFSLRLGAEFAHVIDTACWCWRAGSPPPRETVRLSNDEQELIHKRYPHAPIEIQAYYAADPLLEHRRTMVSATRDTRPRVLQVAHSYIGGGGTEKHSMDLAAAVSGEFLNFGAAPHEALTLYCENVPLGKWSYEKAGWPLTTSDLPANDRGWVDILNQVKPKLIHLQHLLNHPLSLLAKLTGTGIPMVVSLHDYYFFCPDFHLHNCPGVHSCKSCFPDRFKGPAQYQTLRRDLLGGSLRSAAALVAPSASTAKLMREVYPDLNVKVIPHGIRGPARIRGTVDKLRASRAADGKIRFGMIGNLLPVKGIDVIFKVWPLVAKGAAELHIYGASDIQYIQRCKDLGIYYHGPYGEADLPQILSQIDVGIMPAQVQETFSYTLSEFFAGGVPVIGSDYGALGDRIESGVNGLKVPHDDIQAWVQAINLTISDASLRERMKQGVRLPDSIEQMAVQYAELYREVIQRSAVPQAVAERPEPAIV
jgi:glycosyltransferase involved in cell wall biosynthesis